MNMKRLYWNDTLVNYLNMDENKEIIIDKRVKSEQG